MGNEKRRSIQPPIPRFRAIPFKDIPSDLQPLAVKISKLEDAIITTNKAIDMNFDHLIDLLVDLKKTSMDLIKKAKTMEKVAPKKDSNDPKTDSKD